MTNGKSSSKLLEDAVNEFAKLPGIGKKTAMRLVMHLLKQDIESVNTFGTAMIRLRNEIQFCEKCHNISEAKHCHICADSSREQSSICVVENVKDIIAVENTQQYHGLYHVLGGIISPMEGIGPTDLKFDTLEKRVSVGEIKEVILALSATMEGDTTNFYIFKKLMPYGVTITTIARGVSVGNELEYTDELTLGRSIVNRIPFSMGNGNS
jgi:recombination protein RecR